MNDQAYRPDTVDFFTQALPQRTDPRRILMCSPEYFDIVDVKNVHMQNQEGQLDRKKAVAQWHTLRTHFEQLEGRGFLDEVAVVDGQPGCEDMVFCANQTFPWLSVDGQRQVVLSKMRHESRQREVTHFEEFFSKRAYQCLELSHAIPLFEGMGDAIPHPGRRLLYGGYGHRTDPKAYDELAQMLQTPIITFNLVNPGFYHLDTCFLPVDEQTVLYCAEAFDAASIRLIQRLFDRAVAIPESEASTTFSLNAHVVTHRSSGEKAAVIQQGATYTNRVFLELGVEVIETDTSEYLKSGGSVFCMKMMFY